MRPLRRFWKRLRGSFAGSRGERELADEIQSHLEMQIDENLRCGMSPEEARGAALRTFGGIEAAKEGYRAQRSLPFFETSVQEVRYTLRSLRRNPGFTAVAVCSLALGIAGTTAIFGIVNSTLLRSLPYTDPSRLSLFRSAVQSPPPSTTGIAPKPAPWNRQPFL